jgi:NAD(P)-dependent dehydrogenase (short-subunit alcohol dehydrogenase family)
MVRNVPLVERTALITGANQGIGTPIARALASQGARNFLTYLRLGRDDPGAQATALVGYTAQHCADGQEIVAEMPSFYHVGHTEEDADVILYLTSHQAWFATGPRFTLS